MNIVALTLKHTEGTFNAHRDPPIRSQPQGSINPSDAPLEMSIDLPSAALLVVRPHTLT